MQQSDIQRAHREKRNTELEHIKTLLSSPDGELLMRELRAAWDSTGFYDKEPHTVQYMAGQRDCFKFIEMLQRGDLIHE